MTQLYPVDYFILIKWICLLVNKAVSDKNLFVSLLFQFKEKNQFVLCKWCRSWSASVRGVSDQSLQNLLFAAMPQLCDDSPSYAMIGIARLSVILCKILTTFHP